MKYFTKEWYELMQRLDYTVGMRAVADNEYTDADIAAMYERKLKADIKRDRDGYDSPPQMLDIDFDDYELDDFVMFDEERGVLVRPQSMDEVKRDYERQYAEELARFESRPPFDPTETEQTFKLVYEGGLKNGYSRFPDWVKDCVDVRLIALGCLPKSVFDRLKAEQKRNKAEFDRIERTAQKALSAQSKLIPERILHNFGYHDGEVCSLCSSGDDLVMTVREDGVTFEDETPYVKVMFVGGKVLERDDGLKFERRKITSEYGDYYAYCTWLYDELYKTPEGYEAHMLLAENELCYLTIRCTDIIIEKNVRINEE